MSNTMGMSTRQSQKQWAKRSKQGMAIEICTRTRVLVCMYVRVYTYVRRDSYMYMYILCTYVCTHVDRDLKNALEQKIADIYYDVFY